MSEMNESRTSLNVGAAENAHPGDTAGAQST